MGAVESMRAHGYDGPITVLDSSPVLPHDRPPLTKQVLGGQWDLDRAERPVAGRLGDLDVRILFQAGARSLDVAARQVELGDGTWIESSAVVLATGSRARTMGGPLPSGSYTVRTGSDSVALRGALEAQPDHVVVVGAGFIGAEVASVCRERGLAVTMIEAAAIPMERILPGHVGGFVADLHRSNGVDVRLSAPLKQITTDERGVTTGVELASGEVIEAPVVVVGIGASPNVEWLGGSGLDLVAPALGGGIACDSTLLAAPGIVAAGDVASWPNPAYQDEVMRVEHWENAIEQGTHAGARVLAELDPERWGPPEEFASVPWFWSDQFGTKIQMVGRPGPDDEPVVVVGALDEPRFVVLFRRGDICTAVLGLSRPRQVMQARMAMADSLAWDGVAGLF